MKPIKIQELYNESIDENYIFSFEIQSDDKPTEPLLHKHSRFLYIIDGIGKIKIQDKIIDLSPGVIIQISPWQISEIVEVNKKLSYYLLVYNFNLINIYIKKEFNIYSENVNIIHSLYLNNTSNPTPYDAEKIKYIFEDIKYEFGYNSISIKYDEKPYSTIYAISKLSELLVLYLRNTDENIKFEDNFNPEMIFSYMFLNCSNDINLDMISQTFFMSKSSISKYIHDFTGCGFYELLQDMKLFKAEFLLTHTNMSIQDIANTLNYSDPGILSKIFKEKYNLGTKDFKKINLCDESLVNMRLDYRGLKIIDYMYDNYAEDIDIVSVSNLFKMPPKNINGILLYYIEKNFYNFLNQIRVHKSCDLLVDTNFSITEISYMVGYNSTKTFLRNFNKILNTTPSQFRNTHIK